jgi:prophage regulatory protein
MPQQATTPRRILRQATVLDRLDHPHPTTLARWEAAGKFPQRVQLGPNSVGWFEDEIEAWLEGRQRIHTTATGRRSPNPRARPHAEAAG